MKQKKTSVHFYESRLRKNYCEIVAVSSSEVPSSKQFSFKKNWCCEANFNKSLVVASNTLCTG